mmetsp:Transcript_101892/g.175868  ORF Transcript_101892/g.175868 Transcript_101892/m.175868 type:complete len:339 (-) Transcript_101892:1889-2905(-)
MCAAHDAWTGLPQINSRPPLTQSNPLPLPGPKRPWQGTQPRTCPAKLSATIDLQASQKFVRTLKPQGSRIAFNSTWTGPCRSGAATTSSRIAPAGVLGCRPKFCGSLGHIGHSSMLHGRGPGASTPSETAPMEDRREPKAQWWPFAGVAPDGPKPGTSLESFFSPARTQFAGESHLGWRKMSGWGRAGGRGAPPADTVPPPGPHRQGKLQRILPYFNIVWSQHESKLARFLESPPEHVSYRSVPWPDVDSPNDLLKHWLDTIQLQPGTPSPGCNRLDPDTADPDQQRKRMMRLWHPDRFQQLLARSVEGGDRNRIMERVTGIFQLLNLEPSRSHVRSS